MHLDHDTDQWRAVVNTVMNLKVYDEVLSGSEFLD
jgi:hypothetical protein